MDVKVSKVDKKDKGFRLLTIYERLNRNMVLCKNELAEEFGVDAHTIFRDINDLRAYRQDTDACLKDIPFQRANEQQNKTAGYYIEGGNGKWFTSQEALAISKILLESRAFNKVELDQLLDKLMQQVSPEHIKLVEEMINNEKGNYIPPQNGKALINILWSLACFIKENKTISFNYTRQDGTPSRKTAQPVAIMFSEFYFYLIAFTDNEANVNSHGKRFPLIFRVDRISRPVIADQKLDIKQAKEFNVTEFRKLSPFMYGGEIIRAKFKYSGVLEALLDRLPAATVIGEAVKGVNTISVKGYARGLQMWLDSQGEMVTELEIDGKKVIKKERGAEDVHSIQ